MSPRWSKKIFTGNCLSKTLCSSAARFARQIGGVGGRCNPDPEQLTETDRVPWTKKERVKPALIILLFISGVSDPRILCGHSTIQIIHR